MTEDANGYKKVNITAIIGGEPNTAEYTVKNPLTFICNTIEPRDWYTNNKNYQDNTLWDSNKTVSDPCPHGWKVPTDGTWGDFSEITFLLSGTEYTVSIEVSAIWFGIPPQDSVIIMVVYCTLWGAAVTVGQLQGTTSTP